jgi:hypothetical protein
MSNCIVKLYCQKQLYIIEDSNFVNFYRRCYYSLFCLLSPSEPVLNDMGYLYI